MSFTSLRNHGVYASGSVATPKSPIDAPRESGVMLSEVTPVLIGLNSFLVEFPLAAKAYTGKNSDTRIIVII